MGSGEMGVGEGPATAGSFHSIGPGGIPLKKRVMPKKSPGKLSMKKNWKQSFKKFSIRKASNKHGS